jgi:hypothetical protein
MRQELKIISMSLYGSLPIYNEGAVKNAELAPEIYPGWTLRVYVDDSVPRETIERLSRRSVQIVRVQAESLGPMYGRFWRLWVAGEADVDRFIVRDADSLLNSREAAAVAEWIASNKSFHIMRDGITHDTRILSGMWGGIGGKIPDIRALTDSWGHYSVSGDCDQFSSAMIFPRFNDDYICHDHTGNFDDARPFPPHAPMKGTVHIGEKVPPERYSLDSWLDLRQREEELAQARQQLNEANEQIQQLVINLRTTKGGRSLHLALAIARTLRAIVLGAQFWRRRPG